MNALRKLLRPDRIGQTDLRNRLVISPMETMYGNPTAYRLGLVGKATQDGARAACST